MICPEKGAETGAGTEDSQRPTRVHAPHTLASAQSSSRWLAISVNDGWILRVGVFLSRSRNSARRHFLERLMNAVAARIMHRALLLCCAIVAFCEVSVLAQWTVNNKIVFYNESNLVRTLMLTCLVYPCTRILIGHSSNLT